MYQEEEEKRPRSHTHNASDIGKCEIDNDLVAVLCRKLGFENAHGYHALPVKGDAASAGVNLSDRIIPPGLNILIYCVQLTKNSTIIRWPA